MNHKIVKSASSQDLLERAIQYVVTGVGLDGEIVDVGGLKIPSSANHIDEVKFISSLLTEYRTLKKADRPISIAVFGPPGSGKSSIVEDIARKIEGYELQPTLNLTQIAGTTDLAARVASGLKAQARRSSRRGKKPTPIFFFDEFDAALDGTPLGWLSWFLAPMQDGKVMAGDQEQDVGKAVFIFAGGTAETLNEFDARAKLDPGAYRARKVPDFLSRLRGAINISGINGFGEERIVPRALKLQKMLEKLPATSRDEQRIRQLLSNGHFVHGARSMRTLVDAGWDERGEINLPDAIRRQHFTRGPLDGRLIGISAGVVEPAAQGLFSSLTKELLRGGAALAYGGALDAKQGTLERLLAAARETPPELGKREDAPARVLQYLGYPTWLKNDQLLREDKEIPSKLIKLNTISVEERRQLGVPLEEKWFPAKPEPGGKYNAGHHVAWALSLFRLRVRMLQDMSALVVLGGKDDGKSWGRMAGVAEEVMIALALGKPIFVLGEAGGAARPVGQLLGLAQAPAGLEYCLKHESNPVFDKAIKPFAQDFEIPGLPNDSPGDIGQLRRFLFHRGVTTAAWPWNGLEVEENRVLFECEISKGEKQVKQAVELIMQGLSRIEWKPSGERRSPS